MINIRHFLILMSWAPILCIGQTSTENYVLTETILTSNATSSMKAVQYFNGLGNPTVAVGNVGGNGQTAYSLITYDALGREKRKYLPVSINSSIAYRSPGDIISDSQSSNGYNDNAAYTQTSYDALDRPVSVTTAGNAFSARPSSMDYTTNTDNEVICYQLDNNASLSQNYSRYNAGKLKKETSTDPDGKMVETFRDLFGNVIMQRVGGNLCTYYVYDNLGRLRYVLPPKYQTENDIDNICYEYQYDNRGRVVYKKLPGAGYCEYGYDDADRMIWYQDAEMRSSGKKRFFVYDKFDHLVIQGMCTTCQQSGTVQNATFSSSATGVLGTGYVMPSEFTSALGGATLEIANYYDGNQRNLNTAANVYQYLSGTQITTTNSEQKGMLTATVSAAAYGQFVAQTMLYDIRGNLIKSQSKEIGGTLVTNDYTYTYTNKQETSATSVNTYGGPFTANISYEYNNTDNKSSTSLTLNHGANYSASINYYYDKLGRMENIVRNGLPSTMRNISYTYDMHGWLKSITTNSFTEELFYETGLNVNYYNGNISGIKWKDNTSNTKRGYRYYYDSANRMTAGNYAEGNTVASNTDRYSERVTYDANGNVTSIARYGKKAIGYGLMDNLTISYNGNQLSSVSESVADYDYTGSFEYKRAKGTQYIYNANGSLVADKSRGIVYITYDFNNNPKQIYFDNGNVTKYVYSAAGQKLRVVHYTAKPNITRQFGTIPPELTLAQILQRDSTDYLLDGILIMKNGKIDKYLFEGGYAQATSTGAYTDSFAFNYYNQDHLGNNREVVDASGSIVQVTNYYPFGTPYADASASQNPNRQQYKYNGKELDIMHGLNTYDYGARQNYPILCRWDRIDPLCEKYYNVSPYNYCMNNPIRFIDPDGRIPFDKSVEHKRISSPFGMRKHPITGELKGHGGIDLATEGTGHGVHVLADGVVKKIGWDERKNANGNVQGYGRYVIVQHKDGYETLYGHLEKNGVSVSVGDIVSENDVIGLSGNTGGSTAPHLHIEIGKGDILNKGNKIDPSSIDDLQTLLYPEKQIFDGGELPAVLVVGDISKSIDTLQSSFEKTDDI